MTVIENHLKLSKKNVGDVMRLFKKNICSFVGFLNFEF